MEAFIMISQHLSQCPPFSSYLLSGRPQQLETEATCSPWLIFEADWSYRYCASTVVRAAMDSSMKSDRGFLMSPELTEAWETETLGSEVMQLSQEYEGEIMNFCDLILLLVACGELLDPCYGENLVEVEIVKLVKTLDWLSEYEQP